MVPASGGVSPGWSSGVSPGWSPRLSKASRLHRWATPQRRLSFSAGLGVSGGLGFSGGQGFLGQGGLLRWVGLYRRVERLMQARAPGCRAVRAERATARVATWERRLAMGGEGDGKSGHVGKEASQGRRGAHQEVSPS